MGTLPHAVGRSLWRWRHAWTAATLIPTLAACSRPTKPLPPDGGTVTPTAAAAHAVSAAPVHDAASAATGPPLLEGEHVFDGKLGAQTAITARLVRTGEGVNGAYTYASIGRSIAVAGKVEPSGDLVLSETVNGRTTGILRLRRVGDDLVGQWSDPEGKKTFPVRLSPARVGAGPTRAKSSLAAQALRCLDDLACPAAEATRLFVASDDAHEIEADCFRFLDGAGVPKDVVRGRGCLERVVRASPCDGSSAFLPTAELATMQIDGVAGPVDVAAARALFATCFADVTKDAVLEHAKAKELDRTTPVVDFCSALGGTTLVWEECAARQRAREQTRARLAAKSIAATLDAEGKRLLAAAEKAHADYARARVLYVFEVFSGGSVRNAMALGVEKDLEKSRGDDLTAFSSFKATAASDDDVTRATRAAEAAFAAVETSTPAEKKELGNTAMEWTSFRDAEEALYERVFGPAQGADRVRRAMLVRLAERRAKECGPPEP
jgi:hypothetical protein